MQKRDARRNAHEDAGKDRGPHQPHQNQATPDKRALSEANMNYKRVFLCRTHVVLPAE